MSSQLRICIFCMATALVFASDKLTAQSPDEDQNIVNYSYAVVFGTGVYKVEDQTAFIFRAPFSCRVREPSRERSGIKLLLPALMGYYDYDYDKIFQGDLPGNAATLSFVPGLEFEYVMNERWRLKPYGQVGFGRDLKNNENALIYVGGVNSHYRIPNQGKWHFALGNTVIYTGYDPDDGGAQSIGILGAGIDMISPWGLPVFGKETNLANYLIYYLYLDNPGFEQRDDRSKSVSGEIEWGLALEFEKPPKLMGIEFERIGLGFRYGDNIRGIRFVTKFPF
ncbi:MAG: hypothetical protein ABFS22_09225 [Pseudomonadota bacterium]